WVVSSQGAVPPSIRRLRPTRIPDRPETRQRPNSRALEPTAAQPLNVTRALSAAQAVPSVPAGSDTRRIKRFAARPDAARAASAEAVSTVFSTPAPARAGGRLLAARHGPSR